MELPYIENTIMNSSNLTPPVPVPSSNSLGDRDRDLEACESGKWGYSFSTVA